MAIVVKDALYEEAWDKFTNQSEPISCPSCGHESTVCEFDFMNEPVYWVACSYCGLRTDQSPSKEQVIKTWNRRDGDITLSRKANEYVDSKLRAIMNQAVMSSPPPVRFPSTQSPGHSHQVPGYTHGKWDFNSYDAFNFFHALNR